MPVSPLRLLLAALAVAGVFVGVAMVLLGLPEATPAQSVLLELSSLPFSASVAAGVAMLHSSADRPVGPRGRVVLSAAGATIALGLLLMVAAYLIGPRTLVLNGQLLVWLGLFAALLVMIRRQPRRRSTSFSLRDPDEADDEDDDPVHRER